MDYYNEIIFLPFGGKKTKENLEGWGCFGLFH